MSARRRWNYRTTRRAVDGGYAFEVREVRRALEEYVRWE